VTIRVALLMPSRNCLLDISHTPAKSPEVKRLATSCGAAVAASGAQLATHLPPIKEFGCEL
jgi:hypothetical protein